MRTAPNIDQRRGRWRRLLRVAAAGALACLVAVVAIACGGDDSDDGGDDAGAETELEEVRLVLPFSESISFIGLSVAQDRFFAEEGLEVETPVVDGCGAVPQALISGQADYALLCTDSVMVANGQGQPMRQIALLRRNAFTIATEASSDIQSIADLEGGALGITERSGGEVGLVTLALDQAGLDSEIKDNEDVEIKVVGPGGPQAYNALTSGEIDAYAGALNDLAVMRPLGLEPRPIIPEELEQLPSSGLTLMEDVLNDEEGRDIAIRLARAWLKGNQFALDNPDEALEIICQRVPEECDDREVAEAYLESSLQTIETPSGLEPGEQAPIELYETVEEALLAAGDLESEVDLEQIFTNEYIDEINEEE